MIALQNPIQRFVEDLEASSPKRQVELLQLAAIESGGLFKSPRPSDTWDNQKHEIGAYGLHVAGDTIEEAIRHWIRVAKQAAETEIEIARCAAVLDRPTSRHQERYQAAAYIAEFAVSTALLSRARSILAKSEAVT